jgi:serine/threonine protein phosphatase PrpC
LDTIEVQKDDIIILSSDGLWDVIKGNQLQEIMKRNTTEVN